MARPHIIYILADDMGYGDARCNWPESAIPTPNLDRLAARGMRFTDAHAASAVCTPSRYNVLTGRYAWRSRLKQGIVWEYDGALIEPGRQTVAGFLRDQGDRTACIGKWHLGWDWPTRDGRHPNQTLPFGLPGGSPGRSDFATQHIDFGGRIAGGPVDRGFDSYFGVDVPNFPPYTWFVDDRLDPLPTETKPEVMYGHPGAAAPGWSLQAMIPTFVSKAVEQIEAAAADPSGKPLFLFLALTSPHSPVVPNERFRGVSGIGAYGDFVCEVDWVVGEVMSALDRTGLTYRTLVLFTSDNGPEKQTRDDEGVWERARRTGHYSMGPLRGIKRDAWEGGHRVPLFAAWPGVVPAGAQCDRLVALGDFFATCADLVGKPVPSGAAEDSVSFWPLLRGDLDRPTRQEMVYHSMSGVFALRRGDWVLIDAPTGADNEEPAWFAAMRGYTPHHQPGELFHLGHDLPERVNRYADHPELVAELRSRLRSIQGVDAPKIAIACDDPPA